MRAVYILLFLGIGLYTISNHHPVAGGWVVAAAIVGFLASGASVE